MKKLKVGITGQAGFMGTHLFNSLKLKTDSLELIPFKDEYFDNLSDLQNFVKQCDTIVHLAAMNRHGDPQVIYDTNIRLVKTLLEALDATGTKPHILFSSSTQEEKDNLYGKSKRDGRRLFEEWARKNNTRFTAFIIPNVFGPFGNPYYNSFIATFCHQLTHNETPRIDVDGQVKLIYISELVDVFYEAISSQLSAQNLSLIADSRKLKAEGQPLTAESSIVTYQIPHTIEIKVSRVLELLEGYKANYFEQGIIPDLSDSFERNLFNTFVCYIDHKKFFPFHLIKHSDDRGAFVELVKLNSGGQVSFSTTVPDITRGNHFHIRKAERFAVIKGKARIELRRIGTVNKLSFELDGNNPSFVDMPIWHTHNITNIGDEELYTIFWISEQYDPNDADTFFENV